MFERIYNLKNKKKGFTLVELIVVLVILAILLAILVPSMTGWISKAKEKQILLNARTVYLACQTVGSENYGTASSYSGEDITVEGGVAPTEKTSSREVYDLAALKSSVKYTLKATIGTDGTVSAFTYSEGEGSKTVTLDNATNSLVVS